MKINRGREAETPSDIRTATFTGEVRGDPVLTTDEGVTINNVFFPPGARTHWHTHAGGQVLHVLAGRGRVRARDGVGETIGAGDVVWISPGEEHWHGADRDSYMLHMAISLGDADWHDAVGDDDYAEDER
jgi:quercetin dioxygenase-like cupin family protein